MTPATRCLHHPTALTRPKASRLPSVWLSILMMTKNQRFGVRYFCIKDKGYHVSVWPRDQGFQGLDYIEFNIAGITHGEHISEHLGEFIAYLEPDPANLYDANAIKILARNGDRLGYVPKDMTREVRNFTSLPCKCYCYIGENNGVYYSCCYVPQN
jgi:hypothetical protein